MGKEIKIGLMVVVALAALVFPFMTPSSAKNQKAEVEESDDIDTEAVEILKKATDYLTGITQFRLKGYKETDVVQESGQKLQFSSSFEIYLKRPDCIFVSRTDDDGIIRRLWYDGKTVSMFDEGEKVYAQIKAPDTLDSMLDYLEIVMKSPFPLADLFYNDLSPLFDRIVSGMYLDISFVKKSACDHLAFRGESIDWQIWIERGEKPLIRKIVTTYKELPGEPQLSARLDDWDIQPQLSDALFQFTPPEGARRIPVLGAKRPNAQQRGVQ
jgi:hypothetical protein